MSHQTALLLTVLLIVGMNLQAADKRPRRKVEQDLKRTCTRCHRLDVVQAQRLERDEWERELDKMTRMGAKIPDRAALLEYLVQKYGPEESAPEQR